MNAIVGQCNHFVTRKKRFCRMTVRTGAIYCGEHEPKIEEAGQTDEKETRLRVACPLDPKHTCYISKLEKHLKVCNAKQGILPAYIKKDCNLTDGSRCTDSTATSGPGARRSLANVSDEVLSQVVSIVSSIYNDVILGNIMKLEQRPCHASVSCDLDTDGRGDNTRRHLLQTSSLIYILQDKKLVREKTCFVELGAGKGHLSYYLSKAVHNVAGCSVLLVDRASHRHKQDNKLRELTALKIERIRADISHLFLANVPTIQEADNLVAVSKHLCGVATDLALNCVTNSDIISKTTGLVMATCCHHRCVWETYVGRSFLQENNVTQSQFDVICGLVSWATCGSGLSRERRAVIKNSKNPKKTKYEETEEDVKALLEKPNNASESMKMLLTDIQNDSDYKYSSDSSDLQEEDQSLSSQSLSAHSKLNVDNSKMNESQETNKEKRYISLTKHLGLSVPERAEIGFKAKAILDWGRLKFLREKNFNVDLCFYVDKVLSPENVCIVAVKE